MWSLEGGVSRYLVHMPVIRYLTFVQGFHRGRVPLCMGGYWVGLSCVLACVLFEWVEEPARRRFRAAPPRPPEESGLQLVI